MKPLAPFKLEKFFAQWEFKAELLLCSSDVETMPLSDLLDLADDDGRKLWETQHLGYTETFGAPWLREEVAKLYPGLEADDILCFAGAGEGIYATFNALLADGGHAITLNPSYQSLESIADSLGTVTAVPLREEDKWALDLDGIRDAIRPDTHLIAVNFPHNPTGYVPNRDTFDELIQIARDANIPIFCDEVYRLSERSPDITLPPMASAYEQGVSLGVMSKSYGLPGLRVGWIACRDRTLLARMEELKHYLSICNAGPSETLSFIALRAADHILARNQTIMDQNLTILDQFLDGHSDKVTWHRPQGGCIGFLRFLTETTGEEIARRLLEQENTLLMPGSCYPKAGGGTFNQHARIGFGRKNFSEGMARFDRFLKTL